MYENWIEKGKGYHWVHKRSKVVSVSILPNMTELHRGKWFIFHTHPAPGGRFVLQPSESAKTMKKAREMALVHLRHWNNADKWTSDPDYGK